jgi:hypothetical protein
VIGAHKHFGQESHQGKTVCPKPTAPWPSRAMGLHQIRVLGPGGKLH